MAHINRGMDTSTHSVEGVRCSICKGDGRISAAPAALMAQGKNWRDARVARGETLLEMSRRLGMSPADLSAIEVGRAEPAAYDDLRKRLAN